MKHLLIGATLSMNKPSLIKRHLLKNDYLTLDEAMELIGDQSLTNPRKGVTEALSRMIKQGMLRRVRNGIYTTKSRPTTPHSVGGAEGGNASPLDALARRYKDLRDRRPSGVPSSP